MLKSHVIHVMVIFTLTYIHIHSIGIAMFPSLMRQRKPLSADPLINPRALSTLNFSREIIDNDGTFGHMGQRK